MYMTMEFRRQLKFVFFNLKGKVISIDLYLYVLAINCK